MTLLLVIFLHMLLLLALALLLLPLGDVWIRMRIEIGIEDMVS
jgi:hypothetical protein